MIPAVFVLLAAWSLLGGLVSKGGWFAPSGPKCLLVGMVLGLVGWTAWGSESKKVSRYVIQACVVMLGLRLDLHELGRAAADGLGLAVATIAFGLLGGMVLSRLLKTGDEVGVLVSSGTAICGGSAIAAVGGAIGASSSAMAVATGAIFLLNAAGLYMLPAIGHGLGLSEAQFGAWAGVALHGIASVAGAGKVYGPVAVDTAMVVKLVRVIWIAPIALGAAWWWKRKNAAAEGGAAKGVGSVFPWFVVFFAAASCVRTVVPETAQIEGSVKAVAGAGFQLALFLIGAGLSRSALAKVGWRAILQATTLWVLMAGGTLAWVKWGA
jgi:uncharacterized integral membrane protein (TIGR00698 family)